MVLIKANGIHWDILLIGLLTMLCSIIGLPWMCGAAAQSLAHCSSLSIMKPHVPGEKPLVDHVIEQRLTTIAVSILLGLCAFAGTLLRYVPFAVMYGVFLYLGIVELMSMEFTRRLFLVFVPPKYFPYTTYCQELAEHLATLHAFSLTNKNWKNAGIEMGFCKLANSTFWLKLVRSSAKELIDNWSDELGSLTQKAMDELCVSTDDLEYVDTLHIEMDLPPVLCHGDLHVANMIFDEDDKFLAMLDWQVSHAGSIGEDFARLFTNSVPGELRRNHYMEVLNHYYEKLTHKLGRNPPYSFEKLVENYKRCFKGAALSMVINMPMILTYGGKLESDTLKEVLFRCKAMLEDTFEYEKLYKK